MSCAAARKNANRMPALRKASRHLCEILVRPIHHHRSGSRATGSNHVYCRGGWLITILRPLVHSTPFARLKLWQAPSSKPRFDLTPPISKRIIAA